MPKVFFARSARRAFNKLWRLSGKPTLNAIRPVAEWELPAGVAYDAHRDRFVDQLRMDVEVDWREQPAVSLGFLPEQALHEMQLDLAGLVTSEAMHVVVLWSQEAQDAIASAWGVAISGRLYRVDTFELRPAGVETPTDIAVSLVNAKS